MEKVRVQANCKGKPTERWAPRNVDVDESGLERSRVLWTSGQSGRWERMVHGVFDHETFMQGFADDLDHARALVLIQSPYITLGRIKRLSGVLQRCVDRGIQMCVFLQQPREWTTRTASYHPPETIAKLDHMAATIKWLESFSVHVTLRAQVHEKLIVVDDSILWEGTLNALSHYDTSERINRWVSRRMVREAIRKHNLAGCKSCPTREELMFFGDQASEDDAVNLGKCIARNRKLTGLSQSELARKLGLHQSDISEIEAGKRNIPLTRFRDLSSLVGLEVLVVPGYLVPAIKRFVQSRTTPVESDPR